MKSGVLALLSLVPLVIALVLPASARAAPKRIAVLEFTNEAGLSSFEIETLADDVRGAALVLPSGGFTVMTRESMMAMLPPGTDLSKCTAAECEVDAGRKVGADLVVAGTVGRFSGKLLVRLKLFDTASAALLGQRSAQGSGLEAVRGKLGEEAKALFRVLRGRMSPGVPAPGVTPSGPLGEQADEWDLEKTTRYVVRFDSEPAGALVEADGSVLCDTPCSKSLEKGSHRIAMKKARYGTWDEEVRVSGEQTVRAKLAPEFGWLSVTSEPSGLAVEVNDEAFGTTPIEAREVDPGSYAVVVKDERHYDAGERVTVQAGGRKTVAVTLKPKLGGLEVTALDPAGNEVASDVYVDGEKVGRAPWLGKVIVGEHEVKVAATDGRSQGERATIALKQVQKVAITLPHAKRQAVKKAYSVSTGATWTDPKTRLVWQRTAAPNEMNWESAKTYCRNNEAGLPGAGWHLPTKDELESLVRKKKENGCYWDANLQGRCSWFWSSSPVEGNPDRAWVVHFGYGSVGYNYVGNGGGVRCVRPGP